MHWTDRLTRRPAINTPGDAHELTFTCYHRYAFLTAERTCMWLCNSLKIHNNPVRRGLVARAEDWKWSSAGWFEGKNPLRPDPLDFGGTTLFVGGRG